jgi:hypothetical protein
MDGAARLAVAWFALACLAAALSWAPAVRRRLRRLPHPLLLAAVAAMIVRALPTAMALPLDALVQWDVDSYRAVAAAVRHGRDVYDLPGRYPYLPLHLYVLAATGWLAAQTPVPFLVLAKLPAVAADAALAVLVGRAAAALGREEDAPALAMVCALNPVSLLVTGYHGQFDAVPTALLFGAWYGITFRRGRGAMLLSALLLGFAVADKTWPLVPAPVLFWRVRGARARAAYAALAALPPVAALALYELLVPGGALHALSRVAAYQGMVGAWGYSELLMRAAGPDGAATALRTASLMGPWTLLGALACAYTAAAGLRRDPERIALILCALFVASAGWGAHWTAWVVPFALAGGRRWGAAFLLAAGSYTAAVYLGFGGVLWLAVWLSGSLRPAPWSHEAGLLFWAALTAAVAAGCLAVFARDLARLIRRTSRRAAAAADAAPNLARMP